MFAPDFFKSIVEGSALCEAVMALWSVQIAPSCVCLSWPLLRTLLSISRREQIRCSIDVIVEACRAFFTLDCTPLDVVEALNQAPPGEYELIHAPWPLPCAEQGSGPSGSASVLIRFLGDDEGGRLCKSKVCPPYTEGMKDVVEEEMASESINPQAVMEWVQLVQRQAAGAGLEFNIARLLALVESHRDSAPAVSVGTMLWFSEKVLANGKMSGKADTSAASGFCAADGDDTSRGNIVTTSEQQEAQEGCVGSRSRSGYGSKELTPLEAFISGFYDDLRSGSPLYLTQLNKAFIIHQSCGFRSVSELLAEVPGVKLVGRGKLAAVQVSDAARLAEVADKVMRDLQSGQGSAQPHANDPTTPKAHQGATQEIPNKVLARIWDVFQCAPSHEIPVKAFMSAYKTRFRKNRLQLQSLGYPDIQSFMAGVPFVEQVNRGSAVTYGLKAGARPPDPPPVRAGERRSHTTSYGGSWHQWSGERRNVDALSPDPQFSPPHRAAPASCSASCGPAPGWGN